MYPTTVAKKFLKCDWLTHGVLEYFEICEKYVEIIMAKYIKQIVLLHKFICIVL